MTEENKQQEQNEKTSTQENNENTTNDKLNQETQEDKASVNNENNTSKFNKEYFLNLYEKLKNYLKIGLQWLKENKYVGVVFFVILILIGGFAGFGSDLGEGIRVLLIKLIPAILYTILAVLVYLLVINTKLKDYLITAYKETKDYLTKLFKERDYIGFSIGEDKASLDEAESDEDKNQTDKSTRPKGDLYGFVYINFFTLVNILLSLCGGIVSYQVSSSSDINWFISLIIAILVSGFILICLNFALSIIKNIAIIARNTSQILKKLNNKED